MPEWVKTRVLIISDTHCAGLSNQTNARQLPFSPPLPSADLLIHCGDLTHTGKMHEYERTLDMLKEIDAPVKLVIAGNHDMSLDREFVHDHDGRSGAMGAWSRRTNSKKQADDMAREAHDLWSAANGPAKQAGITFLDEGTHQIDLPNGGRVCIYASPYTPSFCDWGFAYEHDEDRFNNAEASLSDAKNIAAHPIPSSNLSGPQVDICVTHGPPYGRLDQVDRDGVIVGCPHLLRAIMRARPLVHCFGHIHEGWGAERIRWSDHADELATKLMSTLTWKESIQDGFASVEEVETDEQPAGEQHGVFFGLTDAGVDSLERGKETLLVNASIMDVRYNPRNAPWVIDLHLLASPKGDKMDTGRQMPLPCA